MAVGASVLALTGCYNQAENEAGGPIVKECPKGYVQSGDKPIKSPQKFNTYLSKAVTELSATIPRNLFGYSRAELSDLNKNEQGLLEASKSVFYLNDNGFRVAIDVSEENKIDDPSEQLCSDASGNMYVSQNASQAIGAMESAGIDVTALKNNI